MRLKKNETFLDSSEIIAHIKPKMNTGFLQFLKKCKKIFFQWFLPLSKIISKPLVLYTIENDEILYYF